MYENYIDFYVITLHKNLYSFHLNSMGNFQRVALIAKLVESWFPVYDESREQMVPDPC